MKPLYLYGCRHDILGHYLKAIGLLRTLSQCADEKPRDPEAEGWWDLKRGCFCLCSEKYSTKEELTQFFAKYYRPTAVFAAWNKNSGISKENAGKFGHGDSWKLANFYSNRIVPPKEKQNSVNKDKLISEEAFRAYRDESMDFVSITLDAVSNAHSRYRGDNPLFLIKGIAGRAHLWRTFWNYVGRFEGLKSQKKREPFVVLVETSMFRQSAMSLGSIKGKGTPFFPDAIKSYNIGSGWVTENYPFNALDYILAVEGAFAMRGSVARTLAANSKRFAAFPFVFDSGEDKVNHENKLRGTADALWFPLWNRRTSFGELSSFISDAQTRLPGKEARFSAEFVRALYAQGVDAGFAGWQEFRFKMIASDVPWTTTGHYVKAAFRADATRLNRALYPLDESCFLDQFKIKWNSNHDKAVNNSPHVLRAEINDAMERAAHEPTSSHCLNLLGTIFRACRQIAVSKSFRENLSNKRGIFFRPLPAEYWNELFADFDEPEFYIARALASISGLRKQLDGTYSKTLPMLGSILPLKLSGAMRWYLPNEDDRSNQAVWSGTDLCFDLAAVLARRYMDSLGDDRPALLSKYGAPLNDVLAFLRGELDDQLIAQWTESLSLIDWKFSDREKAPEEKEEDLLAIPPEYAALRTLVEVECERQKKEEMKKRRSQQPISLLCSRSFSSLPLAVSEALRWIAIWGVPNPYRDGAEPEKKRLAGRDIIHLETPNLSFSTDTARLAAAVCIPLHWRDRHKLFKAVSIPQTN